MSPKRITFKVSKLSTKESYITMYVNFIEVGILKFKSFVGNQKAYKEIFSDVISVGEYNELTDYGSFFWLETLYINERFRMKGYANKLITYFIEYTQKNKNLLQKTIFLQAQPMEFNIEMSHLKAFYKKYNFCEIPNDNIYDEYGEENNVQQIMGRLI